jgi:hypothetical protein
LRARHLPERVYALRRARLGASRTPRSRGDRRLPPKRRRAHGAQGRPPISRCGRDAVRNADRARRATIIGELTAIRMDRMVAACGFGEPATPPGFVGAQSETSRLQEAHVESSSRPFSVADVEIVRAIPPPAAELREAAADHVDDALESAYSLGCRGGDSAFGAPQTGLGLRTPAQRRSQIGLL